MLIVPELFYNNQMVLNRLILMNKLSFIQGNAQPQTLQSFGFPWYTKTYLVQVQFLKILFHKDGKIFMIFGVNMREPVIKRQLFFYWENTFLKAEGRSWDPESLGISWQENFRGKEK